VTAPNPALVERFRADLAALSGPDDRLLLAVSGGPDSLAMLLLAHAAMPERIACATVDHGLRQGAADEAAMVAAVCADRAIPHATLYPDPPLEPGGNVQARARAARYDALAAHTAAAGCAAILTAHHADDQAETLLMRASRGSGVDGLAGVRVAGVWGEIAVLRPLLGWRRAELTAVVSAAGLSAADDPSNRDPAHDRSRVRALIGQSNDIDPAGLARSAAALADASDALRWSAAQLAAERVTVSAGSCTIDSAGLPREYRRRLLTHGLATLGEAAPRGPALDRLLAKLDAGESAMLGTVLASAEGAIWRLVPAPPRRSH
jgi:tRNA(Ile)-lysidine synthase